MRLRWIAQSGRAGRGCCDPAFTVDVAFRDEEEAEDYKGSIALNFQLIIELGENRTATDETSSPLVERPFMEELLILLCLRVLLNRGPTVSFACDEFVSMPPEPGP